MSIAGVVYLHALTEQSVEETDEALRQAQEIVCHRPTQKATVTLTIVVEYNEETSIVETSFKVASRHAHIDPQCLSTRALAKPPGPPRHPATPPTPDDAAHHYEFGEDGT